MFPSSSSSSFALSIRPVRTASCTAQHKFFPVSSYSGVWDKVNCCLLEALVVAQFMLVNWVKVASGSTCVHGWHLGHQSRCLFSNNELVFGVVDVICRFETEALGFVWNNSKSKKSEVRVERRYKISYKYNEEKDTYCSLPWSFCTLVIWFFKSSILPEVCSRW